MTRRKLLTAVLACGLALPAAALNLSWSGFGTLGYAESNREFTYNRFINDGGTFLRDTVLGGQLDAQFTPEWSATAQVTIAPSMRHDKGWSVTPSWAFVAWRPTNDWLVRVGRLRLPLYLHSESLDVGQAHDFARLPAEMYSIAPSNDYNGVSVSKTWPRGDDGEFGVDLYHGMIRTTTRIWLSDGAPPYVPSGPVFSDVKGRLSGLVFTLREPDLLLRASMHRTAAQQTSGAAIPVSYPYVAMAPGLGYYQVNAALPGPGVATVQTVHNTILTLGGEYSFGPGWKATAELARTRQQDTELGSDTRGGYLALSRHMGAFTPYVYAGALRSTSASLAWQDRLTGSPLPSFIPGADQLNAAQKLAAETTYMVDQRTWALGAAYRLGGNSTLKAEWSRTHIGRVSRLVDTPAGSASPRDTNVDVLSFNYSFVF